MSDEQDKNAIKGMMYVIVIYALCLLILVVGVFATKWIGDWIQ